MTPAYVSQLENHLWQSTLCAAIVGVLTLLLTRNRAQVRYWLWLSASLKFAIPFSLLIAFGSHVELSEQPTTRQMPTQSQLPILARAVFVPAASATAAPVATMRKTSRIPALLLIVWGCGFTVVLVSWWRQWRRIRKALRAATRLDLETLDLETRVQAMSSPELLEPGIFGIWCPVLLLPEGITDHLTPAQLDAIVAHELCHARRGDNLGAAVHMAIEAVFWFYPLVWWLGRRIIEERERACDEQVLSSGRDPQVYAEGILKVCEFYLESPLAFVAGVTSANLRRRIRAIMTDLKPKNLNVGKKLLLTVAGMATVTAPIAIGVLNAPQIRAQSQPATPLAFEVASIKPNKSADWRGQRIQFTPGGRFSVVNLPLDVIIAIAYNVPFQSARLTGGPDWARSDRYDIEATAEKGTIPEGSPTKVRAEKMRLMLQTLLAERFKLTIRSETKEQPVYALVVGKDGPKLQAAKIQEKDCSDDSNDNTACHQLSGGQGQGLHGSAVDLSDVALFVANWTDRPVLDRTGIEGLFNIQTEGWTPLRPRQALAPGAEPSKEDLALSDPTRPTLFMILQRLGLKLESQKAPVEMFVIEHVDRPSAN
jgi:uncharacterized protein (TIGR03435 family)